MRTFRLLLRRAAEAGAARAAANAASACDERTLALAALDDLERRVAAVARAASPAA